MQFTVGVHHFTSRKLTERVQTLAYAQVSVGMTRTPFRLVAPFVTLTLQNHCILRIRIGSVRSTPLATSASAAADSALVRRKKCVFKSSLDVTIRGRHANYTSYSVNLIDRSRLKSVCFMSA